MFHGSLCSQVKMLLSLAKGGSSFYIDVILCTFLFLYFLEHPSILKPGYAVVVGSYMVADYHLSFIFYQL